jgi:transposase
MVNQGKAELFAAIRRDARLEGLSARALARKYGVHRRTVTQALASPWPPPRKPLPPRGSRLDAYKPVIDRMLRSDLDAPRKQRHTVVRILDRLLEEHQAVDISYAMVRDYVRQRRAEIRLEEGRGLAESEGFIEQSHHRPGVEAEVDFGDVWVRLDGVLTRCYLFCFRLSWSGKAVHRLFFDLLAGGVFRRSCARVARAGWGAAGEGSL